MVKNRNIIITGCLQGIGRETLKTFAENGANVIACAYKQEKEFEVFCASLAGKNSVKITPVYFDMNDNNAVKKASKEIAALKEDIHGLINIAGINRDAYLGMITYQDLFETFQINFFSQIIFTQYIVRLMQRRKIAGSVAFTSSSAALYGNEGQISYGASKAALIGAMRSMAIELGKDGIRVNAVAPGVIRSPMTETLSGEIIAKKMLQMDIPRMGMPVDVANMFMFLMSDMSSHITGQVLRLDGGM